MISLLTKYLDFDIDIGTDEQTLLPLFHNCSQREMLTALYEEALPAPEEPCEVFGEPLVYTFYGVSRYISNNVFNELSQHDQTCCLIIDPSGCKDAARIYPFDSGAMANKLGLFRDPPIPWKELEINMDLAEDLARINKLILLCYPDLLHYLKAEFDIEPQTKTIIVKGKYPWNDLQQDIENLHVIMRDLTVADERRFSYEVQFRDALPLKPANVKGFVAPEKTILAMRADQAFFMKYKVHVENGFFYPKKAFDANHTIGKAIQEITQDFTINHYLK